MGNLTVLAVLIAFLSPESVRGWEGPVDLTAWRIVSSEYGEAVSVSPTRSSSMIFSLLIIALPSSAIISAREGVIGLGIFVAVGFWGFLPRIGVYSVVASQHRSRNHTVLEA